MDGRIALPLPADGSPINDGPTSYGPVNGTDGRTALHYAIASIPVPGAPPRTTDAGAAIGLSFLDSALRLNHVRRLTERLTMCGG